MTSYTAQDMVETLSVEQLDLMARSDCDWHISVIEDTTLFDAHRIRLLLELGRVEANRRLEAMKVSH